MKFKDGAWYFGRKFGCVFVFSKVCIAIFFTFLGGIKSLTNFFVFCLFAFLFPFDIKVLFLRVK